MDDFPPKGRHMEDEYVLKLETLLTPAELSQELRKFMPWGHRIDFSNGVSTAQFERRTPFSENILLKFKKTAEKVPFDSMRGGRLLDIGCNSGHNAIYAAQTYGMRVVGIDVSQRHMQVAPLLAGLAGIEAEFLLGDAETFSRPQDFDVVLHFGTLYHLPNPLLSLHTTYQNLRPGGYLALETASYDHPDDPNLCSFVHMQNNDPTNFWAISEHVLQRYLTFLGFESIETVLKATPKILPEHQHRVLMIARKPV
jgi:2-polyprenyl-3-methyl-5-hydroxy-6-metoxy-1,4-benzoquinol methylase